MKVQIKRASKNYVTKNTIKKQTESAWNFLQPQIQVYSTIYFKINASLFCFPLFFKEYLNPQAMINKMVNKHSVDYHPSPSGLTSRIYLLIVL